VDVVFAIDSVSLNVPSGGQVYVQRGSHWSADDPIVRAFPQWFAADPRYGLSWTGEPPEELSEPPLEQTTRAPGERRNVRIPRG
jgi:hypothetical protein